MAEEEGENKAITESRLEEALASRLSYFYEHADKINLLSIRRLLEEDLGLEKFALDMHKRFIKQFVEKNLVGNPGKKFDSTTQVKEATKDCEKVEQLKSPKSKAETSRREESPVGTKVGTFNLQNTNLAESAIKKAILERADYFRSTAHGTLQLASTRRLLEGDLGLQIHALDPFKKFIRQQMEEVLATAVASESSYDSSKDVSGESRGSAPDPDASGNKEKSECGDKQEDHEQSLKGPNIKDEGQVEDDSPIMGLLAKKGDQVKSQGIETNESTIKQAIQDQAHHFRSNAQTLTLGSSRRFLEEKLGLPKKALDPFKKFIGDQIEEVLNSPDDDVKKPTKAIAAKKPNQSKRPRSPETETKSKKAKKDATKKSAKKIDSDEDSKSPEPKSSKKSKKDATKKSNKKIDSDEDSESSEPEASKKSKKDATRKSTKKIDSDEDRESLEGGGSRTSAGKADKKNVTTTPAHSKQVEHLKSIIKACGMGVPPVIYKKAKQVSEGERESFLRKELEDILSKEGLSNNPSEKEIKEVKKRKERTKELEGIDMGNIVTSGRRRSVTSFAAPSYTSREDKVADKAKVVATKKDTKNTNNTKNKDVKKDDKKKKVEKGSDDEDTDGDVAKQDNEEAMEVDKSEVKDEEGDKEKEEEEDDGEEEEEEDDEEDEEEEEDSHESEDFNEGDSDSD